jgi:hypothetical protein
MLYNVTITVDDTVYQTLKTMVEQQTIGAFLPMRGQSAGRGVIAVWKTSENQ